MNHIQQTLITLLEESRKALAKAQEAEEDSGFDFDDTMERKYEEGWVDALEHFGRMTMLAIEAPCEHELEDEYSCSQHSPVYPFVPETEEPCYELRCSNCNEVTLHEERTAL